MLVRELLAWPSYVVRNFIRWFSSNINYLHGDELGNNASKEAKLGYNFITVKRDHEKVIDMPPPEFR